MQYKVLTQRDSAWVGKFKPEPLEQLLNTHAMEGWRLKSVVSSAIGQGGREELVIFLEREM